MSSVGKSDLVSGSSDGHKSNACIKTQGRRDGSSERVEIPIVTQLAPVKSW